MILAWLNLFVFPSSPSSPQVPEEPPGESAVAFPDLIDEANMLEWAGVSLGKGEIYRLFLSIKKLAESLPGDVASLRFFGKINTRGAPYYIVEGLSPEDEEGIIDTQQEGRNGANKYAYWVIQSVESDSWVKLPNVKMAQIVIARQFKRLLTGNLDAPVPSYPPFPGTEKNLLRAQIARIVGSTSVSPEGFFEKDEEQDPPTVKRPEEIPFKNGSDLKESTSWRHHEIELNRMGRITKMPEQTDENGEPIADEEQYNEPLMELTPESWTFRVCPAGSGVSASSVGVARSTVWPGALAVASGRKFVNVYIGNAIIYEATTYTPPLPGPIQGEWMPSEEFSLVEQPDVRKDPTPPAPEGAEE